MTILVASDMPPAVRGMLKRWCIEPRPNIFVGNLNTRVRIELIDYVLRLAPEVSLLVIAAANNSQGFIIEMYGQPDRTVVNICGLQLIAERGPEPWLPTANDSST
jgi:CRISPR-associated endoribonuclease Cas2 subtype I-E